MGDWFGESPVERREISPSHFENWKRWCEYCNAPSDILVLEKNLYLCLECADKELEDMAQ